MCLHWENSFVLVYADDCLIFSKKNSGTSDRLICSPTNGIEKFEFTDEGNMSKYLGVDITKHKDGSIKFTQVHLIKRLVKLIDQDKNINIKSTPAIKALLRKDLEGLKRKHSWNYRQAIGILTYIQGTTRSDISMATHQAARFSIDPKLSHKRTVRRISRYLKRTNSKGFIFRPKKERGLE